MSERKRWAGRVGRVFDTRPRVASKVTVWLERKSAYRLLSNVVEQPGMHVCLDGPTDVGKTSLAHTYIAKEQVHHCAVMVTQSMTWPDFCRRLIGNPQNPESSANGEFEAGLNNGLPSMKFKVYLGVKGRPLDDLNYADKLATTWTEHDVAKQLAADDLVLLIDDLERANDQLMIRIADLCKLLTQSYVSQNSKVLMIGSGDIYVRLHNANPALDERVSQVSLGAFSILEILGTSFCSASKNCLYDPHGTHPLRRNSTLETSAVTQSGKRLTDCPRVSIALDTPLRYAAKIEPELP